MSPTAVLALVVVVPLAAFALSRSLVVVREGEAGIVFRLGRLHRRQRPGPTFVVPHLDQIELVRTSPRRHVTSVAGFTSDGAHATIRLALVVDVIDPLLALRFAGSLRTQACDAVAAATAEALGTCTASELAVHREVVATRAGELAELPLASVGLRLLSLRAGPVVLPPALVGSLGSLTVAAHGRPGALVDAETARLVSVEAARARAASLARLDRVARHLDERTLALERLDVLRVAAEQGGQFSIVTGLAVDDRQPALALPPPRLRDAS